MDPGQRIGGSLQRDFDCDLGVGNRRKVHGHNGGGALLLRRQRTVHPQVVHILNPQLPGRRRQDGEDGNAAEIGHGHRIVELHPDPPQRLRVARSPQHQLDSARRIRANDFTHCKRCDDDCAQQDHGPEELLLKQVPASMELPQLQYVL